MNRVPLSRRVQIINCLVEGNSIRSTERMTGTHRDTICRLLVEVGAGCAQLMDEQMRYLRCRRIEVDEIWAYVGKKQRHMTVRDDPRRVGDQYTFVALDPESKLVPTYLVGKRDLPTATAFMADLSERLANNDALAAYVEATERAFGGCGRSTSWSSGPRSRERRTWKKNAGVSAICCQAATRATMQIRTPERRHSNWLVAS
jgi:hypothetical protein